MVTGMAALAGGCSKVIITDTLQPKLDMAAKMGMTAVNIAKQDLKSVVDKATDGWGADVVFEASGNENAVLHASSRCVPAVVLFLSVCR